MYNYKKYLKYKNKYNVLKKTFEIENQLGGAEKFPYPGAEVFTVSNNGMEISTRITLQCFWISIRDFLHSLNMYKDLTAADLRKIGGLPKETENIMFDGTINGIINFSNADDDAATAVAHEYDLTINVYNRNFDNIVGAVIKTYGEGRNIVNIAERSLHFEFILTWVDPSNHQPRQSDPNGSRTSENKQLKSLFIDLMYRNEFLIREYTIKINECDESIKQIKESTNYTEPEKEKFIGSIKNDRDAYTYNVNILTKDNTELNKKIATV